MKYLRVVILNLFVFGFAFASLNLENSGNLNAQDKAKETSQVASKSKKRSTQSRITQIRQVQEINRLIRQTWDDYELKPSKSATDGEWVRRVYLDIVGRIPSVKEYQAFVSNKSKNKKEKLVNTLLRSDEYTEEFARNWTTIWSNILIGRAGGTERNSLTSREGMQKYLRDAFARNKSYKDFVYELISATGTTTPGDEKFNGATNFLAMKVNEEKGAQATAAVSKTFMGLQVQCTQCHNHPFNEWKQEKYWQMNAFFQQARALRKFQQGTRMVRAAELVDQDFAGEAGDPKNAVVFYDLRNGKTEVALPTFIDGTSLSPSGYVSEVNRRSELAKMIVESEFMPKTMVNRTWGHFFGYGFTKPIDDMGPHNPPSHPELLEYLSKEFKQAGYDVKELIRWITLTDAYSLSSVMTDSNSVDDPLLGESPKFTHFYLRQMRAEELYESLVVATQAHTGRGTYEEQERQKNRWLQQFTTAFGTDEGDETTTFNGTIPQVLMMFNGDLVKKAISTKQTDFLGKLAGAKMSQTQKIRYLFNAGLSRNPTKKEERGFNTFVNARGKQGLEDMWWAILNSNEFIFNH